MTNILYYGKDRHEATVQEGQLLNGAALKVLGIEVSTLFIFGLSRLSQTDNIFNLPPNLRSVLRNSFVVSSSS
jgi:hypothetical protein